MSINEVIKHQKKMGKPVPNARERSIHEAEFERQLNGAGITDYVTEHRFDETRKWRFDFAWPEFKVAVEVEGIVYNGRGRHQTAKGYEGDCYKYNAALLRGWRVLRFVPAMISKGEALSMTVEALEEAGLEID